MAEIPRSLPSGEPLPHLTLVVRPPPVGALVCASYLAIWAMTLAVLSIFTVVAAISEPNPLTYESLTIAFGGVPVFHGLAVLMLTAAYGIARVRPWALRIVTIAAFAGAFLLLGITTYGAKDVTQVLFNGANILGLLAVGRYLDRPAMRAYFASVPLTTLPL